MNKRFNYIPPGPPSGACQTCGQFYRKLDDKYIGDCVDDSYIKVHVQSVIPGKMEARMLKKENTFFEKGVDVTPILMEGDIEKILKPFENITLDDINTPEQQEAIDKFWKSIQDASRSSE